MTSEPDVLLIWINAIAQLPDVKPWAELLRRGWPMPPEICDLLAEYLDPGKPDILDGRLIYKPTSDIKRLTGSEVKGTAGELAAVLDYYTQIAAGKSSQEAALEAGAVHGVSDRTIYNYLAYRRELRARLRGGK
jgi:hypothetical protein